MIMFGSLLLLALVLQLLSKRSWSNKRTGPDYDMVNDPEGPWYLRPRQYWDAGLRKPKDY